MSKLILSIFIGLISLFILTRVEAAVINVPQDYKTIRDAVENANPQDTIIVDEGEYKENIVITKPIVIRASKGPDVTIVHALIQGEPVFKIKNTNEASIIGFTASDSLSSGIYLYNAHNGQVLNNKTVNNHIGITLYSSNNNIIKDNIANSNEYYGIYLESSHNNLLEKNIANSNKDKGIFLSLSSSNNLNNNSANLNTWNGIILWSSHKNTLKDNKIFRNTYGIVTSDSDNNDMINNSTWPNIYIILPVILIYIGILLYLIQKNLFRFVYKG